MNQNFIVKIETSLSSAHTRVALDTCYPSKYDIICFNSLPNLQAQVTTDEDLQILERFEILMYDRSTTCTFIIKCREALTRRSLLLKVNH